MAEKKPAPVFKTFSGCDPIVAEARQRWNRCSEYEDPQRKSILEAKQFRAGDQWDEAIKISRQGGASIAGQPAQPARPCLVVDRLSPPLRQVINGIKNSSFGFDVLPNGHGADKGTAEILDGYLRRVVNTARDEAPIEWAAEGAAEGGIGWFRLLTQYVHENWTGEPDPAMFDQELAMARITNNLTVYCDPSSTKPTRSDAMFMFVTEDVDKEEFKKRWPRADLAGLEGFAGTGDPSGWVTQDQIRIAEYWRIEFADRPIYMLKNGGGFGEGEPLEGADVQFKRVMRVPTVKGSKINACQVLEEMAWVGSHIPLIPVLGEELNVDGRCVLRGMIQEGMDAQRMVNYSYSAGIEAFALATKSTYVYAAGQIENYKEIWGTRNIYNHAGLPYDPMSVGGTLVPPPQMDHPDFAMVQAGLGLMAKSEECVAASTSYFDPTDADLSPAQRTGVAIQSMQGQAEGGNSHYPKNTQRAVLYAAKLMLEVIPKITRPGQIVHILGADDEPQQVIVGQPFVPGENGVPQPAPDMPPEAALSKESLAKFYDFNNGIYAVTVDLGKGAATRQQEGSQALGALIPHLPPEMAAVATPDFVEQLSFPGAHQIAAKLRKVLPPGFQDQDGKGLPPQIKGIVDGLQAQLAQANQAIATDQAKQQATLQKAQMDGQVELQKAKMDNQTRLEIAKINAQTSLVGAELKAQTAEQELRIRQLEAMVLTAKEQRLETDNKIHDIGIAKLEHAHAVIQAAQGASNEAALAQQKHEHDMAQQAAASAEPAAAV